MINNGFEAVLSVKVPELDCCIFGTKNQANQHLIEKQGTPNSSSAFITSYR
jgi:hypothetical protein